MDQLVAREGPATALTPDSAGAPTPLGPPTPSLHHFTLLRADDLLELDVQLLGSIAPTHALAGFDIRPFGNGGTIAVQLRGQHLLESLAGQPSKYVFSGPSRLLFRLAGDAPPIPGTVEGILAALRTLPLVTDPAIAGAAPIPEPPEAAPAPAGALVQAAMAPHVGAAVPNGVRPDAAEAEERRRTAAEVGPELAAVAFGEVAAASGNGAEDGAAARAAEAPAADAGAVAVDPATVTELKVSSRLGLSPRGGATRFVHSAKPVAHNGLVEPWHTRLARLTTTGRPVEQTADVVGLRTVEPTTSAPAWAADVGKVEMISGADRKAIVEQSRQPGGALRARHLMLSALGAWTDLRGSWPAGPGVKSWRHQLSMGRDQYQRTVIPGRLYPFGHPAVRTDVTERTLGNRNGGFAQLRKRSQITVREPVQTFGGSDAAARQWPFTSVELLTDETPEGTMTSIKGEAAYLERGSGSAMRPFAYRCRAVDRGGRTVTFDLPLVFVPDTFTDFAGLNTEFAKRAASTFMVGLGDQRVTVAQPAPAQPADGVPRPPDGAEVIVGLAKLGVAGGSNFRPFVEEMFGRVPGLEQFGAPAERLKLRFAEAYKAAEFGAGNPGEVLLQIAGAPALSLVDAAGAGGLVSSLGFTPTGLSRKLGPVAGDLGKLALEQFDPRDFLGPLLDRLTLFGVFPLGQLVGAAQGLQDAPRLASKLVDGVRSQTFEWSTRLFRGAKQAIDLGAGRLRPMAGTEPKLAVRVVASVDPATQRVRAETTCKITDVELGMGLGGVDLVVVPVRAVTFASVDGRKPDVKVQLGDVGFRGVLGFVGSIARLVDKGGFSDLNAIDLLPDGVRTSFSLPAPPVAVGMFSVENVTFGATFDLPFTGRAPELSLSFSRADNPFRVAVLALAGGGFFGLTVNTQRLVRLEGALEFGAAVSVHLGVARGSVSIMGGVYFRIESGDVLLTGYLRVKGELEVLCIVSVGVELNLALSYEPDDGTLTGEAEVVAKFRVLFVKKTVRFTFRKTFVGDRGANRVAGAAAGRQLAAGAFAGSDGVPGFADLMDPAGFEGERPWDAYCRAFAAN